MFKKIFIIIFAVLFIGAIQAHALAYSGPLLSPVASQEEKQLLAQHQMSLEKRYAVPSVNQVFKDNILLNAAYLAGTVRNSGDIKWEEVRKPFKHEFILQPGQVFAFHNDVLPEYQGKVSLTTNAHFNAAEGFLSDGYLYGDGVCHFASLLYWAAKDAGLSAKAPVNHDFMVIQEIPREYGVSIYSNPGATAANAQQNLYVENTFDVPVQFVMEYANGDLKVSVYKMTK